MAVYIPSMEMPTVCIHGDWFGNCPMDRTWCAQRFAPKGMTMGQIAEEQQDKLPEWCPLRPLPEKHGRLIDVDAFKTMCREAVRDIRDEVFLPQDIEKVRVLSEVTENLCLDLDEAPTIIEAED